MAVIGPMLAVLALGVFLWAVVGLIRPEWARLPNRASAVKLWAVSVAILVLGAVITPPPTEAELAERRAAAEAREDAQVERAAERAATEAAREAEEAAAREAEAVAAVERERAEAAEEVFEKLTVISNPAWGDHDRMLTRYRYVIPRIAANCADAPNAERAGDMIVAVGNHLHEAGLSDGYQEIADIFYRMTVELAIGRPDFACAETFGSYAVARLQGMEPSEAEKGILGIYRALGR